MGAGSSLGEKGKCLAHTESAGESANGPQHKLPGFVHLGPRAQLSLLLTLPVESLLVFKAQDKSHFLSELFLERLPPPSSGIAVLNSISLVLSSLKAITRTFSYICYPNEPLSPLKLYHTLFITRM